MPCVVFKRLGFFFSLLLLQTFTVTCRTGPAGLCGAQQVRQRGKKGGESPPFALYKQEEVGKHGAVTKTPRTPTEDRTHLFILICGEHGVSPVNLCVFCFAFKSLLVFSEIPGEQTGISPGRLPLSSPL